MFRNSLFFVCTALALLSACTSKPKAQDPARATQHRIDSLERRMLAGLDSSAAAAKTAPMAPESEMENVLNLVKEYQLFAADFPHDTATPGYLLKEGQLFYSYLRDYEQSSRVFGQLIDSFPQAKNRPSALFFLANARQDAGDTAGAQMVLRKLANEHPGTGAANMGAQLSDYIRRGKPSL